MHLCIDVYIWTYTLIAMFVRVQKIYISILYVYVGSGIASNDIIDQSSVFIRLYPSNNEFIAFFKAKAIGIVSNRFF